MQSKKQEPKMNPKKNKEKQCKYSGCEKMFTPRYSTLEPCCSYECTKAYEKEKAEKKKESNKQTNNRSIYIIPKVSKKQSLINREYAPLRREFLSKPENQICFVDDCGKRATTIEHTRGRGQGYFDEWAEKQGICKTLDQRFWKPCCLQCNLEFEINPELSKKYQISKIHGGKKT